MRAPLHRCHAGAPPPSADARERYEMMSMTLFQEAAPEIDYRIWVLSAHALDGVI